MSLISVVVPVYKVEAYLCRCVDSILNQTIKDFDLILVDDGSPDNCPQICDEYAKKDNRVHVIHQVNSGLSAARNTGIDWTFENSQSQWISFVDSDDWIHPEMLKKLYESAVEFHSKISICNYIETLGGVEESDQSNKVTVWTPERIYVQKKGVATVAWGKLYSKDCFREKRYPIGKIHEDEFLTYQVLFDQDKVIFNDMPLYYYFQNNEGIIHSAWTPKRLQMLEAIKEQLSYFEKKGYVEAWKRTARSHLWTLAGALSEIEKNSKYDKYKKELKRQLRKALKTYKNELGLTIVRDAWLYESAYPIRMKLYWYYNALKNAVRGR